MDRLRVEIAIQLAIWDYSVTEELGIAVWDKATEEEREPYLKRADHFLSIVIKRVKEIDNPHFSSERLNIEEKIWDEAIQAVIKELELSDGIADIRR